MFSPRRGRQIEAGEKSITTVNTHVVPPFNLIKTYFSCEAQRERLTSLSDVIEMETNFGGGEKYNLKK